MSPALAADLAAVDQAGCDAMGSRLASISARAGGGAAPRGLSRHRAPDGAPELPLNFAKYFAIIETLAGGEVRDKTILDVGCGAGGFMAQAIGLGMHATGIDIYTGQSDSRISAEAMLRRHAVPEATIARSLRHADITRLPADLAASFDFAVSVGMLEHIAGRDARSAAVRNMVGSLNDAGTLLLACAPNRRLPFDLFHYGPHYPFYHWLPHRAKTRYMRHLIRPRRPDLNAVQRAPDFLRGVSVREITAAVRQVDGGAEVVQAFALFTRLAVSRDWLRRRRVQAVVGAVSRALVRLKMEPLIILVIRRSAHASPA